MPLKTKQKKTLSDSVRNRLRIAGAVLSGVLLMLSFPPVGASLLAWIALIPLIMACSGVSIQRAARLGWLAGVVFFVGSLFWLRHVTWVGYLALACYCALYFIPCCILIAMRPEGWGRMTRLKNLGWMAGLAAAWAASEYARATLLTGFPWNLLGVSQYAQTSLIQLAEFGGVYLLSALMVFVNAGLAVTLMQYTSGGRTRSYKLHIELVVAMLFVLGASTYGLRVLWSEDTAGEPVQVALVQPNIPETSQELADPELVYDRLEKLTELAVMTPDLDLVVWPETALPDFVRYSARSADMVKGFSRHVPLLVGSMDMELVDGAENKCFNASMLFNTRGQLLQTYNKQHLVLFGEYIPFDEKFDWINALTPIPSSFTPGRETTRFNLPGHSGSFSVLICFEDTLPYLARRAARNGASWLINQTNDSWFDPDCGSVQHVAHAVFRCVENRRPMVRCANSGITCSIDSKGRIKQTLKPRTQGFHTVTVSPAPPKQTVYTRFGDLFAQACLLITALLFAVPFFKRMQAELADSK